MAERGRGFRYWIEDKAVRILLNVALALPYETRVPLMGWVTSRVIAPIAGYRKRIRDNLAHACPDLDEAEVRRLVRAVPENVGRSMIEAYSGNEFVERLGRAPIEGPGVAPLARAKDEGQPVIFVTGHFGNYDAARAAMIQRGYNIGVLYNPMKNAYFNEHYEKAMSSIGTPIFPRGRRGLGELVRFIRDGGMAGIVIDQYMRNGEILRFFDQPARTALSAAELALKYNALCVPVYSIRRKNGLDFKIVFEAPLAHTDAITMTQALNDSLEARVRAHMDQWLWIHRRWKPERLPVDAEVVT